MGRCRFVIDTVKKRLCKGESAIRLVLVLGLICLFSASLLSFVYAKTKGKIEAMQEEKEKEAMRTVLEGADKFVKIDGCDCWRALDEDGNLRGYVFKTKEKGYSSQIVLMVGVGPEFKISGIEVLSQNETPGLGTRIVEVKSSTTIWDKVSGKAQENKKAMPWFLKQFIGKGEDNLCEVETISGATISSSAVIRAVKKGIKELKSVVGEGK